MLRNNYGKDQIQRYKNRVITGLPWWLSGKESACQFRSHKFDPQSRKILWRRKWKPTPVFLPGKSHRQWSRVATVHGVARVVHDLVTKSTPRQTSIPPPTVPQSFTTHYTYYVFSQLLKNAKSITGSKPLPLPFSLHGIRPFQ